MFVAALFTIGKMWKQPTRPLTDERKKSMWYINTTECYSAFKKKEILRFVSTWINLEDIMLSEINLL